MRFRGREQTLEIETTSIRRQDILCLFLYYLGFSRFRDIVLRSRRIPVARILAFHDVSRDEMQSFRKKLEVVKKMANIVSLNDILDGKMSWRKINIAITFDDGYRGWIDYVYPVLRDLGISATFFVSSGLVGLHGEEERNFFLKNLRSDRQTTGSITAEELRKLAGAGFAIGGHTCNHVNVADYRDLTKLNNEVQKDKINLEKITGTKVEYFAYPFGFYHNSSIDLVQMLQVCGYRGAVTLVPGVITTRTNSYYLHRDLVRATMSVSVFKARLMGNYDGVIAIRKLLRL